MEKISSWKWWPAIQGMLAIYGAVFTTWAYFYPKAAPAGAPAPTAGFFQSMPPWVAIGLVVLFLSLSIPAVINLWRRFNTNAKSRWANFWQWIGKLNDAADLADELQFKLERLEYTWTKDSEQLVYPLADSTMPQPNTALSWKQRELLGFRFLYKSYVDHVRELDSDFRSNLIDNGFPCGADCPMIKKMIQVHAELLRAHAERHIQQFRG